MPTEYDTIHPKLQKIPDVLPLQKQEKRNQLDVALAGKRTVQPWHSLCMSAFNLGTVATHSAGFPSVSSDVRRRQRSLEGVFSALQLLTWLHEQDQCRALS